MDNLGWVVERERERDLDIERQKILIEGVVDSVSEAVGLERKKETGTS